MRLRRRDIFLLLVGWVFVAVVLVTLVVVFRSQGSAPAGGVPGPVPTYTVAFTQITARSLYPAAEGAALAWQPDAQLVSLTATWRRTAVDQVGAPVEWVFRELDGTTRRWMVHNLASQQNLFRVLVGLTNPDLLTYPLSHFEFRFRPPTTGRNRDCLNRTFSPVTCPIRSLPDRPVAGQRAFIRTCLFSIRLTQPVAVRRRVSCWPHCTHPRCCRKCPGRLSCSPQNRNWGFLVA